MASGKRDVPIQLDKAEISQAKSDAHCGCCSVFIWVRVIALLQFPEVFAAYWLLTHYFWIDGVPVIMGAQVFGSLLMAAVGLANAFFLHRWVLYRVLSVFSIWTTLVHVLNTVSIINAHFVFRQEPFRTELLGDIMIDAAFVFAWAIVSMVYWKAATCQRKVDKYPF
ncbi:hypothetical protein AAVH_16054 [Aphelenchoides avenae]|nr:hypothetical protein AAVH_16054 [Aphelenchus avenae]